MSAVTLPGAGPEDGLPRPPWECFDPADARAVQPIVERLGYLGEFFQVLANVPGATPAFLDYAKLLKGALGDRRTELIALAVCGALEASYERIQHERLAQRLGLGLDWIAAASLRPQANPAALDAADQRVLALAVAVAGARWDDARHCCAELARHDGAAVATAALVQATRYVSIASLCHTLQLTLPVGSLFASADNA